MYIHAPGFYSLVDKHAGVYEYSGLDMQTLQYCTKRKLRMRHMYIMIATVRKAFRRM